jgi:deoxycytidine triphosphate deaminase
MSHLSYSEILKNIENGNIIADGVKPEQIKDQSIDVSLGEYVFIREESVKFSFKFFKQYLWLIFVAKRIEFKGLEYFVVKLNHNKPFWAIPGMFILAYTKEFVGTVGGFNLQPSFKLKSTSARHGIQHPLAGLGEVGFFNRWCLELTFAVPVALKYGDLIGQIYFDTVIGEPSDYTETGSYQSENTLEDLKAKWKPEDILPGNIKNVL